MTTINNPTVDRFQVGDVVTLNHAQTGSFDVTVNTNGNIDLPGLVNQTPAAIRGLGYRTTKLVRRNPDELTLSGTITNGRLVVELELPSGRKRTLFNSYVSGSGSQSVKITKADFDA